jgi:hypothetical protein
MMSENLRDEAKAIRAQLDIAPKDFSDTRYPSVEWVSVHLRLDTYARLVAVLEKIGERR